MSSLTVVDEIQSAIESLRARGIDVAAVLVDPPQSEVILNEALCTFVEGGDRRWWWESLKPSCVSRHFSGGDGWRRLSEITPDPNELVWLIAEENGLPFYPVFETTPAAASRIIGECYGFEYYLVSKSFAWLLCENHHNTIFAVGSDVSARLSGVAI